MADGTVLANIILSGDEDAARGFENVSDSMEESAGSAGILSTSLSHLAGEIRDTIVPARLSASAIDEAGDEAQQAGAEAAAGAAGFTALSASTDGLRLSMGAVSGNISSVILGVGGLLAILAPLVPVLGLAAGALGGLAVAFGAILGSGLYAFSQEMGGMKKTMKSLQKEIKPLIMQLGKQFVPLIKDAVAALPGFIKSLINAVGNLKPFVDALRALGGAAAQIIPKLVSMFVNVARAALPALTQVGNFIAANLVPTLQALFTAGRKAAGPVARLGLALFDLAKSLAPVAGIIGRVVLSLYDLAAVGIGTVATGITAIVNALRRGISAFRKASAEIGLFAGATRETFAMIPGLVRSGMAVLQALVSGRTAAVRRTWQTFMNKLRLTTQSGISGVWRMLSIGLMRIQSTIRAMVGGWSKQFDAGMTLARNAIADGISALLLLITGFGVASRARWKRAVGRWRQAVAMMFPRLNATIRRHLSTIRTMITQFGTAAYTLWRLAFQRLPAPIRSALTTAGAVIRRFSTRAIAAFRRFGGLVRSALTNATATFARLRAQLNRMLPPFLRIRTTAQQLGAAIKSKLLPALGATGLLGIATTLVPLLGGRLLTALGGLRGVVSRLAILFGGPLVGALRILLSPLTRLGTLIGGTLVPALARLGVLAGGTLLSALTTIGSLVGGVIVSAFTTLSTLLSGGLLASLSGLVTTLTSVSGILGLVGTAISLVLSPIGLLAAAVAGLYLAWKTNLFGIRDIGMQVFGALKSLISGDMMAAKNQFKKAVSMMGLSWKQNIKPLIASATRIFNRIKQVVGQAMNWLWSNAIQPALQNLTRAWRANMGHIEEDTNQLAQFIKGILNTIKNNIRIFVGAAMMAWQKWGDEILAVTKMIFDAVSSVIGAVIDTILSGFDAFTDLLVGDWQGALDALSGLASRIFGGIWNYIKKWGSGLVRDIKSTANDMKRDFVNGIIKMANLAIRKAQGLVDGIMRWLKGLPGKAKGAANSMKVKFVNGIIQMANLAVDKAQKLVDDIIKKLKSIIDGAKQAGKDLINAFKEGIEDKIDGAVDAVKGGIDKIRKLMPGSDAETGPLSDLTAAGKALPGTLAVGIRANTDELQRAARRAAAAAEAPLGTPTMQPAMRAATGSAGRSGSTSGGTTVNIDQTIERGAFQGVGLDEVRDLATQTFDEWMAQIERSANAGAVDRVDMI
jgi:phage-related protein